MRIARVQLPDGSTTYGCIREDSVFPVDGDILRQWKERGNSFPLSQVKLLAPVYPSNILCVGRM